MSNLTPEELAQAASNPGTFSFVQRLRNRGYPKDTLKISLNEELGYKIVKLESELAGVTDKDEVKRREAELAELVEAIKPDVYTLHMHGISPEKHDAIVELAVTQYPYEYEETANPLTGDKTKNIIPNEKRDEFYRKERWLAHIESIEDYQGNVETTTPEIIEAFIELAPLMAHAAVIDMIDKLGLAVDWMRYIQDEDFFPKP